MEPVQVSKTSQKGQIQQPEPSTSTSSGTSRPRRGRPSGANRVPLTLEERRARNAQYERERREDFAAAQAELAEAAGCDPNVSTINLMAFVITKLKNASQELSIEEHVRLNSNLEAQIASCLERLGPEYVLSGGEDDVEPDDSNTRKRKLSQEASQDEKRMRPGAEQVPSQHPEVEAATGSKASRPRRGRPSGAKRIPLTLVRIYQMKKDAQGNAQYERERREDFSAAQAELAEAAGCDPNKSMLHLMAFVVNKLTNAKEAQSLEEYKKTNENLEVQIASCFEHLGPNFILSDGEDDEPNSRKRKLSEETFGDDKRLRPGEKRMPADWASTADLADAGSSSSPNTLQTTTDGELSLVYIEPPLTYLPSTLTIITIVVITTLSDFSTITATTLDTMSEHDIALLFLTPPSPLLPPPSPSESTPLRLEAVTKDDISLPFLTPPSGSPPLQLESKDIAELFFQDDLRKIYGALNSVDQLG
ncbi:hypothetical protein HF086_003100 [Spodoptera exigua]|uniref:Uncharacterized protein n=1 Tax=Spodoptera exigua TaxID=7107 RepID=A0A922S9V4_SPOEX|nr:hypothetical protein HF086_003100 [Spodoptera exigua]